MSSKILSNLFWFFALSCLWLVFKSKFDERESQAYSEAIEEYSYDQFGYEKYPLFYAAYKQVTSVENDDQKLLAIKKALIIAEDEGFENKKILQYLHHKSAEIYEKKWHFIYAINSLNKAQSILYNQNVARQIASLRDYLNSAEKERSLNDDYMATMNTGPAKKMKGTILVAYVFVDEGIKTRWSNKTKQRSLQVMGQVQQWQQEKAAQYQVKDITFINKTFIAKRNPQFKSIKQAKLITFKSDSRDIKRFVNSIAESLGEKNIGDFIEKQIKKAGADEGVVFLHTNIDQRSFAQRCYYTHSQQQYINGRYETKLISNCKNEYVMLMEKVKRNRWDKIHYAQAHEMMHVFGAADLYNIKTANDYAVTDIMNLQSKRLSYITVEPITAFAIGWQDKVPKTPFKIIER